jgi:hypothetical protein
MKTLNRVILEYPVEGMSNKNAAKYMTGNIATPKQNNNKNILPVWGKLK